MTAMASWRDVGRNRPVQFADVDFSRSLHTHFPDVRKMVMPRESGLIRCCQVVADDRGFRPGRPKICPRRPET